jgi:ribonucleoside-diphosphate reductase alpha chain
LLSSLGYKIFVDRYARKTNDFVIGDKVLVKYSGQSLFGTVLSLSYDSVEIKLENGLEITCERSNVAKPIETVLEMFQRVASAVSVAERDQERWTVEFVNLLSDLKFIPGGRILSAAGSDNLTYYNCFVLPSPKDSREGLLETLRQMVDIMSRGGGVGINISSLRPKDSPVSGVSGRSSGAVSWGALYSFATGLICQGGSRRGALGLVINDWHPDIGEFISCKLSEGGAFSNANISVAVSDAFMRAVQNDSDWHLVFPDTRHPEYDENWDGDLQTWRKAGYPVLTHKTIKAHQLWNAIVENAWSNGEPGVWFQDLANAYSNSHYLGRLLCTNPCFEEPLPSFGVCCLGSLNLPVFLGDELNWAELEKAIAVAVRFLDDVINVTPYFHSEIENLQKNERRIGLGTMGLAETLIRLGLRYGSDDSVKFIDKLYSFIANKAYLASVSLAKEKGRFPAYTDEFLKSGFMILMPKEVRDEVAKYGIRNMTLLTQAPTGSIATMVGTSTGIEPFFDFRYTRKSQLGVLEEYVKVYAEWKEAHPTGVSKNADDNDEALPDYFVTTKDITVEEHVAVQSAVQRWVDASISKTVNLPNNATKDDVSNVFKKLYKSGCKGGTVYRDGSRKLQVLNRQESAEKQSIKELPYKRQGATVSMKTPSGTAHITMNHDEKGQPFEVFVEIGKAGSSIKAMAECIGRLISLIFRLEPIPPKERAFQIIEQLSGIGGAHSVGFGKNKVLSLPDAVSKALAEHYRISELGKQSIPHSEFRIPNSSADICPVCGQSSYVREEGCTHCFSCGHSEC